MKSGLAYLERELRAREPVRMLPRVLKAGVWLCT